MKISLYSTIVFLFISWVSVQNNVFTSSSSLDKSLISLWTSADDQDAERCIELLAKVNIYLDSFYSVLENNKTPHFDKKQYVKYTSTVLNVLKSQVDKHNYTKVKFFVWELLFENYSLRECLVYDDYPLDRLLVLSESYKTVHITVKDPMMDLLEWFEFTQLVDRLVENWGQYDCLTIEQIQKYFPHISEEKHLFQKQKANTCLTIFIESIRSALTDEYEIPCEDLGFAISDILKLYGDDI